MRQCIDFSRFEQMIGRGGALRVRREVCVVCSASDSKAVERGMKKNSYLRRHNAWGPYQYSHTVHHINHSLLQWNGKRRELMRDRGLRQG